MKSEERFLHTVYLICFYRRICNFQYIPMPILQEQGTLVYKWELVMPCKFLNNLLTPTTTINHINAGRVEDFFPLVQH